MILRLLLFLFDNVLSYVFLIIYPERRENEGSKLTTLDFFPPARVASLLVHRTNNNNNNNKEEKTRTIGVVVWVSKSLLLWIEACSIGSRG